MSRVSQEKQAIAKLLKEHREPDEDAKRYFRPRDIRYADDLMDGEGRRKIFFHDLTHSKLNAGDGVARYTDFPPVEEEDYDNFLENYGGFTVPYPYRGVLVRQGLVSAGELEEAETMGIDPARAWAAELMVASTTSADTLVGTGDSEIYVPVLDIRTRTAELV